MGKLVELLKGLMADSKVKIAVAALVGAVGAYVAQALGLVG